MEDLLRGYIRAVVSRSSRSLRRVALLLCVGLIAHARIAGAVDNPDVPDYVAQFEARAQTYETRVTKEAQNEREIAQAYVEYERFLDQELNRAYSALARRVAAEPKKQLVQSQRRWVQFRDAEFSFIAYNWTRESFGTSSAISRGAYRTSIIKDRVRMLLHYLKNYGPARPGGR